MVNDSADVTSDGRLFQICGPTSGKARLATVASRQHQTVGASRTKRSTARQISDAIEWTKVPWRESVQDFGQSIIYSLMNEVYERERVVLIQSKGRQAEQ